MVSRPTFGARSSHRVLAVLLLIGAAGALFPARLFSAPPSSSPPSPPRPSSINGLATRNALTPADQTLIREYADFWTAGLLAAAEDPGAVRDIRGELVGPLNRGGATEVFRTTYGRALAPGLGKVIDEGNAHVSVTGVIVLSQVGTDKALDILVERASGAREPRRHVRLAAARGSGHLLLSASENMITGRDITSAARGLQAAVADEQDCYTLRHQVEAIRVASEKIQEAGRAQVREILVEALESTAERAAAPGGRDPVQILDAVYPALNKMRTSYLQLPPAAHRDYGKILAPALQDLLRVAETRWNELREDDASRKQLGRFIYLSEQFLMTVDAIVRGGDTPTTGLKQAWDEGDAARYSKEMDRWRAVLAKPPY